jgi:hypothetical protein
VPELADGRHGGPQGLVRRQDHHHRHLGNWLLRGYGTVADAFGDTGIFTSTLTVKVVTITQAAHHGLGHDDRI